MAKYTIKDQLIFIINESTQIEIDLFVKQKDLEYCDLGDVYYHNKRTHERYVVNDNEPVLSSVGSLNSYLSSIKENTLSKDFNDLDLGWIWNEYYYTVSTQEFQTRFPKFFGREFISPYDVWQSKNYATFIYKEQNKIYLDITPIYPWLHIEPLSTKSFISYEEFMKTYKRVVHQEIDATLIDRWLQQIESILKIIRKNSGWEE